jgi:hypothetical protein
MRMIGIWRSRARAVTTALAIAVAICLAVLPAALGSSSRDGQGGVAWIGAPSCLSGDQLHHDKAPIDAGGHCLACFADGLGGLEGGAPGATDFSDCRPIATTCRIISSLTIQAPPGWGATWSPRAPPFSS